jgi:hypothetical protein
LLWVPFNAPVSHCFTAPPTPPPAAVYGIKYFYDCDATCMANFFYVDPLPPKTVAEGMRFTWLKNNYNWRFFLVRRRSPPSLTAGFRGISQDLGGSVAGPAWEQTPPGSAGFHGGGG